MGGLVKIVVVGGSGLIGARLVNTLRLRSHEVVSASPTTGVDVRTGEGLTEALTGAQIVIDVSNSPSFEEGEVLAFFEISGRNLIAAARAAGVRHHVVLSVVGTDLLLAAGYFRGKMAQEGLAKVSQIPYTIVRSTQFFEFASVIAHSAADGQTVRLPPAFIRPIAADDVAESLADIALNEPVNGVIELGGPELMRLDEWVRRVLAVANDSRQVTTDINALYFGTRLDEHSLTPGEGAHIGTTRFNDWLGRSMAQA
jgi:uncharacterized protein YbjT (DUF2867 family)